MDQTSSAASTTAWPAAPASREARHAADAAIGLFKSFDQITPPNPRRLRILWVENSAVDCRTWTYYCDIEAAVRALHDVCTPARGRSCFDAGRTMPQLAIIGPRYPANVAYDDEIVGFNRSRYPELPLLILQNKMYGATAREVVGNAAAKLRWARAAGAAAAFTWLTRAHDFTRSSGVPHHWLPFGVDVALYGRHAGEFGPEHQPYDVGFTGASNHKYPLRESILATVREMGATSSLRSYLGTWSQTSLAASHNRSWKALSRTEYAAQISRAKMWVSTTGPENIVGTRYFEVLASGTTLLLCNRPPPGAWVYEGLFDDGVHAVFFSSMDELREKILYYRANEPARQRIVKAAYERSRQMHSWEARAKFITAVAEVLLAKPPGALPRYTPPLPAAEAATPRRSTYAGCYAAHAAKQTLTEIKARGKLHWFTVAKCERACAERGDVAVFALECGGFCSGTGHRWGRCHCGPSEVSAGRKMSDQACATTCNLHDTRPCGGANALALYAYVDGSGGISAGRLNSRGSLADASERTAQPASASAATAAAVAATAGSANGTAAIRAVAKDCGAGFFAQVLYILNQVIYAEERGLRTVAHLPRTCLDRRPNRYFDQARGENVWEYYFEPLQPQPTLPASRVLDRKLLYELHHNARSSVFTYPHGIHRAMKAPKWRYDEAWYRTMRARASAVLQAHVRIKPHVLSRVRAFYDEHLARRHMLGVHMRGTDKLKMHGGRVLKPPEYAPLIARYLRAHPQARIYLATDSPAFLREVREAHGEAIVSYDALRSEKNAFQDRSVPDNYKKGEDALVEALLLSCSSFLLKPASALSEFAVYFNPALHNHTVEMQFELGHAPWAEAMQAHLGSARDGVRGRERCAPLLREGWE